MNLLKIKNLFVLLASAAIVLTSCNDTTNPITEGPRPKPVTSLQATSINNKSVKLKWDASTSETDADFKNYVIDVLNADGTPTPLAEVTTLSTAYTISNLPNEGTVYTFQVRAAFKTDSLSTAASIKWAPATRFITNDNDNDIVMYEYASTFGSGLSLFDAAALLPRTYNVDNKAKWQIGLDTQNGALRIGSASEITFGSATPTALTEVSADYWTDVTTLDEIFDSVALNSATFSKKLIDLKTVNTSKNFVFIIRITEGGKVNYAKVMVIKNAANSTFLFDDKGATNRYVKLQISYQTGDNVPYAKVAVK